MNIFDQYLEKIKIIILNLSDKGELILPDTLEGIIQNYLQKNLILTFQQMLRWFYQKLIRSHQWI